MTDYPYAAHALAMPFGAARDHYAFAALNAQRAGNFDPRAVSVFRMSRRPGLHLPRF